MVEAGVRIGLLLLLGCSLGGCLGGCMDGCLAGCLGCLGGCHSSGTWDDDAENWSRAFESQKPDDVTVIHSRYWRSPHWTYEFEYFFEIEENDELRKQLFSEKELIALEEAEVEGAMTEFFTEKPEWFVPGKAQDYEIYIYKDEPRGNFRIYINKKTGAIFLTDYQV